MKLWYTNNSPFTSYTTVTPHSDSRPEAPTYKIIACIECATVHYVCNAREYKAGEEVPRYSRFDEVMSGSSLEGKTFFKKPQN